MFITLINEGLLKIRKYSLISGPLIQFHHLGHNILLPNTHLEFLSCNLWPLSLDIAMHIWENPDAFCSNLTLGSRRCSRGTPCLLLCSRKQHSSPVTPHIPCTPLPGDLLGSGQPVDVLLTLGYPKLLASMVFFNTIEKSACLHVSVSDWNPTLKFKNSYNQCVLSGVIQQSERGDWEWCQLLILRKISHIYKEVINTKTLPQACLPNCIYQCSICQGKKENNSKQQV